MKENRSWFGLPKLMNIFSQETSTLWKGHNNRIWFQTEDVMMVPDTIGFAKYKLRNWNPAKGDIMMELDRIGFDKYKSGNPAVVYFKILVPSLEWETIGGKSL